MFMITRRMAPVKGICAKNQHSLKIDKTDRKTQEICRFILQEGCNLGQKKKAVLTELPFSKALHSCPLLLFTVRRPRQIHEEQRFVPEDDQLRISAAPGSNTCRCTFAAAALSSRTQIKADKAEKRASIFRNKTS